MHSVNSQTLSVSAQLAKSDSPPGYPQVANFMGEYPEMAMVRRFRGLNARNLLYLQAELVQIEKELLELEKADAKDTSDPFKPLYARDFDWLLQSANQEGNVQWMLIQKMKEKLKEYSKTLPSMLRCYVDSGLMVFPTDDVLIQQTTLAQVANPSKYDTSTMQKWFERKDLGNMPLEGEDSSIWAKPGRLKDGDGVSRYVQDLIAINGQSSDFDRATGWLADKFVSHLQHNPLSSMN